MGICWWCYWGWPKQIRDIYNQALERLDGDESPLIDGPAHMVWEDENFDLARLCLDQFDEWKIRNRDACFSDEQLEIVRQSLLDLVAVPAQYKHEPVDYDEKNPWKYPPPNGWVMER